jgi:hypothetical protein
MVLIESGCMKAWRGSHTPPTTHAGRCSLAGHEPEPRSISARVRAALPSLGVSSARAIPTTSWVEVARTAREASWRRDTPGGELSQEL